MIKTVILDFDGVIVESVDIKTQAFKEIFGEYHDKLDEIIRLRRTIREAKLLHEAKKSGVATPTIFQIDVKNAVIVMEFIQGK